MKTFNDIVIIEDSLSGNEFRVAGITNENGYRLKKIYIKEDNNISQSWVQKKFPGTEVVKDMESITSDSTIGLIIVSSPKANDLPIVENIIRTGKPIRIV